MIVLNAACFFFSLWVASTCVKWTWVWWLNMGAALLNFAIVMQFLAGVL